MTTQFAIDYLLDDCQDCPENKDGECMTQSHCFEVKQMAIKALRDIKEIEEVINCDADAKIKCKMIFNILTAKPHYFEEKLQESEEK